MNNDQPVTITLQVQKVTQWGTVEKCEKSGLTHQWNLGTHKAMFLGKKKIIKIFIFGNIPSTNQQQLQSVPYTTTQHTTHWLIIKSPLNSGSTIP